MKFNRLHINQFGKLQNRTLEFYDGINVIYGPNESGKSTLHTFLESMMFGIERSRGRGARGDVYNRYYPRGGSSTYGGVLEFTQNDTVYSVYRNFKKDPKGYTLMDETHGTQLRLTEEEYQNLLSKLTLPLYRNTLSLRQLQAATSNDLSGQLRNHIINLQTSGSATLNITRARELLNREKKRLAMSYSRESDLEAKELEERMEHLKEEIKIIPVHKDIPELEEERTTLTRDLDQINNQHTKLIEEIHDHEEFLHTHSGENEEVVKEWEDEAHILLENRQRFFEYYRLPLTGIFRYLFLLASLMMFILTAFAFSLSAASFLQNNYVRCVSVLLLCIFAGTLFLRFNRIWDANSAFHEINLRLLKLYGKVMTEVPKKVTNENLQEYQTLLTDLQRKREALQTQRNEDEVLTEHLFQDQHRLNELSTQLEQMYLEQWQRNQNEEALAGLEAELSMLEPQLEQNRRLLEEMSAIDLALETMDHLSTTAFDSFGIHLQQTASRLIHQITGGRYTRLLIDKNLHISLERNHQPVELTNLSCSTLDQVYLSLRIACIEFFWPNQSMPLLLDESFAMYDARRLGETLRWLSESYPGQVLLFTCQHREEEILRQSRIEFKTISL